MAAGLTSEQLATATKIIDQVDLLNSLRIDDVHELVLAVSSLAGDSKQAVLALIKHLHDLENPHAG
jgi:hypothetical protein